VREPLLTRYARVEFIYFVFWRRTGGEFDLLPEGESATTHESLRKRISLKTVACFTTVCANTF
jgi:hypothetical protein